MIRKAFVAAGLLYGLCAAEAGLAQSLSGLKVGDALSATAALGSAPVATEKMGAYAINKWALADGNSLSVTSSAKSKKIVYVELDWGGNAEGTEAGYPDLRLGTTTLAELRQRLGSNGFSLSRMGGVQRQGDGSLTLINCYAIRGQPKLVVAFISKLAEGQAAEATKDPSKLADLARLDAVILADSAYLASIWGGKRSYDKAYRDIDW